MNVNSFVFKNSLKPVDAIVLNKKFMGMIDHYAIYLGKDIDGHKFVANFTDGIQILPVQEINKQLKKYQPRKIERFRGNYFQRQEALDRAISVIGQRAYNFFANNCEHFKNWVHFGEKYSKQVDAAGTALAVTGGAMAIAGLVSSEAKVRNWGTGLALLGIILKGLSHNEEKESNN